MFALSTYGTQRTPKRLTTLLERERHGRNVRVNGQIDKKKNKIRISKTTNKEIKLNKYKKVKTTTKTA